MAKKISSNDIFENDDIFKGVRNSAEATIKLLEKINAEFRKTATTLKGSIGGSNFDSSKAINEFIKATQKANQLKQQSEKLNALQAKTQQEVNKALQQGAKAQAEQNKATQQGQKVEQEKQKTSQQALRTEQEKQKVQRETIKTQREQAREAERQANAQQKADKATRDANSAYKQLERNTRELKNQSKELGATLLKLEADGKKGTAEYRNLANSYQQVTQKAREGDAQLKKLDKTVGDNFRNVGNYRDALGGLQNILGQFGLAFGIGSTVQGAVKSVMEFEQVNATLSAVLGKTSAETKELQNIQRDLGKTSGYTASQVGDLQLELARLGFTEKDLKSATESVLMLAKASGSELGRASEVAGATLRGFGLEAGETQRVVDVMAKSFDVSALGMENFAESMKYVAPVAKSAGVSLEETTAMLGVLSNVGISGSQAGTALRRILGEMAKTGKPASEALADLAEKGITLADAEDEVGKNAQTALLAITDQLGPMKEMTTLLQNAEGSAMKTATTMGDTLGGSLNRLKGAFEGYILDLNESSGAGETLRKAIDFLTRNLETILDTVLTLIDVWVKYKIITLGQVAINKLMASSFMQTITNAKNLGGVMQGVGGIVQKVGTAIKNNLAGIALYVIANIVMKYKELSDIYAQGARNADELKEATADVEANLKKETIEAKALFDALKQTNNGSKERSALITEINSKYGTTLTNLSNEKDFVKQVNGAYEDLIATLEKKAKMEGTRIKFEVSQRQLAEAEMAFNKADANLQEYRDNTSAGGKVLDALLTHFGAEDENDLIDLYNAYSHALYLAKIEAEKYENEYVAMQGEIAKSNTATTQTITTNNGNLSTSTTKTAKTISEFSYELSKANGYLDRHLELMQQIIEQQNTAEFDKQLKTLDGVINTAVATAKNKAIDGEDPLGFVVPGEMYDEVEKQINALYDLNAQYIKQRYDYQIAEIDRVNEYEKEQARLTLKEDYDKQVEQYNKDKAKIEAGIKAGTEDPKSLKNLNDAKLKLDNDYKTATDKLNADNLKRDADALLEKQVKNGEYNAEIIKNDEAKNDKIIEYNDELNTAIEDGLASRNEYIQSATDQQIENETKALDQLKERWETMTEFVKATTDFFIEQSDRRIEKYEEEKNKAEEVYEDLRQLAINGNIDAQKSLAEQQRAIDEYNKKILREEKRQQRLKLASTAFESYNKNVQNLEPGQKSSKALADTIRDITLLTQFVNALPTFYDGTEDTGTNGRGIDGRGGFKAILHPNERVIPKKYNDQIGPEISNEQLTRIATEYKAGRLVRDGEQTTSALNFALLVNKLDEVNKTIKDKPENYYGLGEVTQTMVEIIDRSKKGNTVIYNRYRVKK
jgi:DNA repair exonuclease SbcCD ATPase subunit